MSAPSARLLVPGFLLALVPLLTASGQDDSKPPGRPVRGSIVEDRAARKLLEAGDAREEADEPMKAVEVWQSVIERYPRSRVRFAAHMRLGSYFLERDRAYDKARAHFQAAASEENRDEEQRAEATLKTGICFYEARNYGKCFQVMRDVIEKYPVSPQVNEAYYYIGLGHFQLGHYSRAIESLEKVGTTLAGEDGKVEKVEAGKRLFIKIEDADLAALEPGRAVEVACKTAAGDEEIVQCFPVGRNVRIVLGTVPTRLGRPVPKNGTLEVRGDDKVQVSYLDQHTADRQFNRPVERTVSVVGDGVAAVMDGAFSETLKGVVLGKTVNIQVSDPDRDVSERAESINAVVEVYRRKTDAELEDEAVKAATAKSSDTPPPGSAGSDGEPAADGEQQEPQIDRYKLVDRAEVVLNEATIERKVSADELVSDPKAAEPNGSVHTGVFRAVVSLARSEEAKQDDEVLQAVPGDVVRITYLDERNSTSGIRTVQVEARCVEGNLGGVRVTRAVIADQELRIKTQLKTADALTNIGNRYKEFGLKKNADAKYRQALAVCDEIMRDAQRLGGRLLEETYVQLWKVYYEMDSLELAAAMAERLEREFPNSGFVDDALLQLADVARKQKNLQRAIGIYTRLVNMKSSQLRGEAQFGIAQCYEQMAEAAPEQQAVQLYDRSFQEYKKVFDNFPDSGRVGEAVARMADYYYRQKDYSRAVDVFETVLADHPDAKFLDVILFNYGRCLYRMERRAQARQKFDQLVAEYPESALAGDAKKISDALVKSGF